MKFDFFSERTPPLIGVDISSSAVKMVELAQGSKGAYHLQGYAIASMTKEAVVDGNIVGLDLVADAVKRAWKLLASREKRVALALPATAVITKKVIMQGGMREEDMEFQVEAEANQYIPFPLDEVNIDFQVLGPAPSGAEEVEVLIAASRKEKIEDRVAAAEGAGLKVLIVDVESYATEAAYSLAVTELPKSGKGQTVMVVDVGSTMTHVHVFHDGQLVHSREQAFGGNQLTLEIQRRFGVSAEEAEIAKRNGGLPESYESEVLQPFLQSLSQEVMRSLQFFTNSTQYNKVDHILLAGGCAAIAGLAVLVQEKTQANTLIANPFNHMSINPRLKQQQVIADAPALMIACGLALRRFD
ncbi:pilus assembly protein PilM [Methylobacillus methanolivorans]|uniref:Pilus assembly protein PilM n=1 Tax=Methylobacillus methanolivorans TaxID=1848927 RepID=A0ABW8GN18_9PROT